MVMTQERSPLLTSSRFTPSRIRRYYFHTALPSTFLGHVEIFQKLLVCCPLRVDTHLRPAGHPIPKDQLEKDKKPVVKILYSVSTRCFLRHNLTLRVPNGYHKEAAGT